MEAAAMFKDVVRSTSALTAAQLQGIMVDVLWEVC